MDRIIARWRVRRGRCAECGQRVKGGYARCYPCYRGWRQSAWREPERLPGQAARDAALGRRQFYVYVLATDYGHYVGHTADVRARLGSHLGGAVPSTVGGRPELLWTSRPLPTRAEAARFEAALKSLRDQEAPRYREITGFDPVPFDAPSRIPLVGWGGGGRRGRGGCGLLAVPLLLMLAALLALAL